MKRLITIKGVLDGFRSSVSTAPKTEMEVEESLRSDNFQVSQTVRHGFPYQPTSLAYDPVQSVLCIGTKGGSLRIFGQPGVDCHCRHEGDGQSVIQIMVLVNEVAQRQLRELVHTNHPWDLEIQVWSNAKIHNGRRANHLF